MRSFKEEGVLFWVGKVLMFNAVGGFFFTLWFDKIAGRVGNDYGWVQICGLGAFGLLFLFGGFVDTFMTQDIIPMIKKYLEE